MSGVTAPITKAEATALWKAVDAMRYKYRAMKKMPDMALYLPAAQAELKAADAALRKVQAQVREARKAKAQARAKAKA